MKKPSRQKTTTDNDISENSSKIPFRPRKIRKLISPAHTETASHDSLPAIVKPLTSDGEIDVALRHLREGDPLLAALIDEHPPPALKFSRSPFLSLVKSILYQQLATKAAKSIYTRFLSLLGGEENIRPDVVLSFTPQQLRETGISFRKASYLHDLAEKYEARVLSDDSILEMDDETLLRMLTGIKGIGTWSVHMFMIFSLHRPDVLPVGDLGVRKGVRELYGLRELPAAVKMEEVCEKWRPYRSVGAWHMWKIDGSQSQSQSGFGYSDQSDILTSIVVETSVES